MKAPKEIFIAETPDKLIWSDDPEKLKPYINVYRYLRKDVVDETIETAEDHAYFAGKEKLREELLEKLSVAYDIACNNTYDGPNAIKDLIESFK